MAQIYNIVYTTVYCIKILHTETVKNERIIQNYTIITTAVNI